MPSPLFPRFASQRLTEALADSPVVLIHGPRQCGKTTLARMVGAKAGYPYFTFDSHARRRLFNASALSASFALARQTIHDYLVLLERVFLIERLAPWHSNRLSRLVKTPKLHFGDTGLVAGRWCSDRRRGSHPLKDPCNVRLPRAQSAG